jgi:pimeloyl-ACP methyl ester carboxylesterase
MRFLLPLLAAATLLSSCLPALQLEASDPILAPDAEAGFVPFRDFHTYYERIGSKADPAVVMVHGIGGGSSLFQYRKNAAVIAEAGYSVYALDLLGFGLSSRPAMRYTQDLLVAQLESFLEEVVQAPAVLVANGLSAAYSIRLATERPDLVDALVLIVPTGYERLARPQTLERLEDFERFTGLLGDLATIFLLEEGTQRFFLLDAYIGRESLTPEVLETYDRYLRAENARWVIFSFISGNLDQDVSAYWPRLEQPALIVWGEEARTTPIQDADDFLQARPQTQFASLTGAKLLPNEDRAETFNELVLGFLQSSPRP